MLMAALIYTGCLFSGELTNIQKSKEISTDIIKMLSNKLGKFYSYGWFKLVNIILNNLKSEKIFSCII
jgi:hypothetical protein